jgi:Mg2+ and Co2+ transporter CorA
MYDIPLLIKFFSRFSQCRIYPNELHLASDYTLTLLSSKTRIILTLHARERAVARGIDEKDIIRIAKNPSETVFDQQNSNYKSYGRAMDNYSKQTRYLMLVHSGNLNNSITIITAMWIDPQRLRSYGFDKI